MLPSLLSKTESSAFTNENLKVLAGVLSLFQYSLKGFFAINFHNFFYVTKVAFLSLNAELLGMGGEYIVFQTKKVYERTDHPKKEKKKPHHINWVGPIRLYKRESCFI